MPTFPLSLTTPYGPVSYTVDYTDDGDIATIVSSTERLSATMFKLTYGAEAEQASAYFASLRDNLRFRLEVLPFTSTPPNEYGTVHIRLDPPAVGESPSERLLRIDFWQHYPRLQPALFLVPEKADQSLQRMAGNNRRWTRALAAQRVALEPWVRTLFDIVPGGSVHLVWDILGRLGTATAADRMLTELERKGIHPQGKAILNGLQYCFDADRDAKRLLALSNRKIYSGDLARPYLRIVSSIQSPQAVEVAKRILFKQVEAAPEAMETFTYNGVADPVGILEEAFWATTEFWVVFRYVELFWDLAPAERQIDLEQINKKLAERQFTDTAPVTWRQQLMSAWKAVLVRTDASERMEIIERYTQRREARLQYNALLQLNFVIRQYPDEVPTPIILKRLEWQVNHRYEKVSAQAIAALRKLLPHMPNRRRLNERLMPVSIKPGLRVAKLKLLKMLGEDAAIAADQKRYYTELLASDLLPDERLIAGSIIRYLKLE